MLSLFRKLSLIEGLSLIVLVCIAMPAKYQFGVIDSVWQVGMTHGVLWTMYFVTSLIVSHQQKWSVMFWLVVLFASVIPFACFFLDRKLTDKEPCPVESV
ncbi:MAG: DUF3817 domain-containing protein [Gammaproteobacteria bacterium]|nr:DUF3817 domain-containing protein [Gammaproteobacteria bacterium]